MSSSSSFPTTYNFQISSVPTLSTFNQNSRPATTGMSELDGKVSEYVNKSALKENQTVTMRKPIRPSRAPFAQITSLVQNVTHAMNSPINESPLHQRSRPFLSASPIKHDISCLNSSTPQKQQSQNYSAKKTKYSNDNSDDNQSSQMVDSPITPLKNPSSSSSSFFASLPVIAQPSFNSIQITPPAKPPFSFMQNFKNHTMFSSPFTAPQTSTSLNSFNSPHASPAQIRSLPIPLTSLPAEKKYKAKPRPPFPTGPDLPTVTDTQLNINGTPFQIKKIGNGEFNNVYEFVTPTSQNILIRNSPCPTSSVLKQPRLDSIFNHSASYIATSEADAYSQLELLIENLNEFILPSDLFTITHSHRVPANLFNIPECYMKPNVNNNYLWSLQKIDNGVDPFLWINKSCEGLTGDQFVNSLDEEPKACLKFAKTMLTFMSHELKATRIPLKTLTFYVDDFVPRNTMFNIKRENGTNIFEFYIVDFSAIMSEDGLPYSLGESIKSWCGFDNRKLPTRTNFLLKEWITSDFPEEVLSNLF